MSALVKFQAQLARIQQQLHPKPHATGAKKPAADTQPRKQDGHR